LGLVDPESHHGAGLEPKTREAAIDALASRMRRSRAKGTALDFDDGPAVPDDVGAQAPSLSEMWNWAHAKAEALATRLRGRARSAAPP
jgi:hypothetical protein